MACLFEALHELVQQNHFATCDHQSVYSIQVILATAVVFFRALKQEGVVARLLQLSDDIQQGDLTPLATLHSITELRGCLWV